jgi:ankyrin repeat protein
VKLVKALLTLPDLQVNLANQDGNTALHYLVRRWAKQPSSQNAVYAEVTRSLIARGAIVDAANNLGETPLHGACFVGNTAPIKFLAGVGADLDKATRYTTFTTERSAMHGIRLTLLFVLPLVTVARERFRCTMLFNRARSML